MSQTPKTRAEKLRLLADWLDVKDMANGVALDEDNTEVQRDLREIADYVEMAESRLTVLSEEDFEKFTKALDGPPTVLPGLQRLAKQVSTPALEVEVERREKREKAYEDYTIFLQRYIFTYVQGIHPGQIMKLREEQLNEVLEKIDREARTFASKPPTGD